MGGVTFESNLAYIHREEMAEHPIHLVEELES